MAVIGAGMSGLLMAVKLRQAGIRDVVIFEKAADVGGTWRENRYPGLGCDVPSHLYTYSFEPNPDWSHRFAAGPEIRAYFQRFADKYRLRPCIRFGTEIIEAERTLQGWSVRTACGETHEVDFLVSACGVLHHPRHPEIEGLDSFAGTAFHTARWPDDLDLDGQRVGVIGTGATSIQLVPQLQQVAAHVSVFQRTPQWVMPVRNEAYTDAQRARLRRHPWLTELLYRGYGQLFRFMSKAVLGNPLLLGLLARGARKNLEQVADPELRRKLTPDYEVGCKRLIMSADYYPAVQQPNVEVIVEPIARVTPAGVETTDGARHACDVLVLATGFHAHNYMRPMRLIGEGGVTIDELWKGGPRAYRTVALPGFPNFFMLMGPHSPIGNYSLIDIAERQAGYVMQCVERWMTGEVNALAPQAGATRAYNRTLERSFEGTVWLTGCQSWYLDEGGLPNVWPFPYGEFCRQMRRPQWEEFETG